MKASVETYRRGKVPTLAVRFETAYGNGVDWVVDTQTPKNIAKNMANRWRMTKLVHLTD